MIATAEAVANDVAAVVCCTITPLEQEGALGTAKLVADAGVCGHFRLRTERTWCERCPR